MAADRRGYGPRPDALVSVEEDFQLLRLNTLDCPRDQDFRSKSSRLLKRAASQFVSRHPVRETHSFRCVTTCRPDHRAPRVLLRACAAPLTPRTRRRLILATSVAWRRVAIDGADELIGKGVYYGAARSEADATHGLDAHLIGAGNSAGQAALFFANHARSVTLVARGDLLGKSMSQYLIDQLRRQSNINILLDTEVKAVHGDQNLTAIDLLNCASKEVRQVKCGGLFVFIGADAETGWFPPEIARDARGYVLRGDDVVKAGCWPYERDPLLLETSVPRVFACGDVRLSPVKRVAAAVGEGSMAIAFVHQFLQKTAH